MRSKDDGGGRPRRVERGLIADEQMFTVDGATMRVQVFTAPDVRPALVLSQTLDEGRSLSNGIEDFASSAWRRLLPEYDAVPLVIQYLVPVEPEDEAFSMWQIVNFTVGPDRGLGRPRWTVIASPEQVVGAPVAADRGEQFIPRPPEPEIEIVYQKVRGADLPAPMRLDFPCMDGNQVFRRTWRDRLRWWRSEPPGIRGCCWYHRGDWQLACVEAIALVDEAIGERIPSPDVAGYVTQRATERGVSGWQLEAIASLVRPATAIVLSGTDDYTNGQHRAWAIREQRVPMTITVR